MNRRFLILPFLLALVAVPATAETVVVEADRDATLIEEPDGALANGSGPRLFAGRTSQGQGSVRRALLRFDVASALPERAIIEGVALTLYQESSNPAPRRLRLHRVLADWGEGASSSSGGGGSAAGPGDATWIHTFWDHAFWTHAGGQFVGDASAGTDVAGTGSYTWTGARGLLRDVRIWHAAPHRNFGWVLIGDETGPQTVKSFASREYGEAMLRPVLVITYRTPGKPDVR